MAKEEALRKQAVELYEQGEKVSSIARMVGRSRQWVHKWIKRHDTLSGDWYESQSNVPKTIKGKVPEAIEERVTETRHLLEESPYLESGAYAIWHHLRDQGVIPPSVASINRILNKQGLTRRKIKYKKSGIEYPVTPEDTQIMDLIGPRYLHGGHRFYMLTIISNDTRHAGTYQILTKSGSDITQSVISFWKDYSVPSFLQMDNELSFKGSNRHPRGLGVLIRTALELNVTPVFIPVSEPWRNGVIERFNQHVEKTLMMQVHRDFEELKTHSHEFVEQHNNCHHYSTLGHKTPSEMDNELGTPPVPLRKDYFMMGRPKLNNLNHNEIRFIRLVRIDLRINVLNTEIQVDEKLMHTYVVARLFVNDHLLLIEQDGRVVQTFEFVMPLI